MYVKKYNGRSLNFLNNSPWQCIYYFVHEATTHVPFTPINQHFSFQNAQF